MKMVETNIEDAQLSILIEIEGVVHMVGMKRDRLEAISLLIKNSIEVAVPTEKTQNELRDFLGYKKEESK